MEKKVNNMSWKKVDNKTTEKIVKLKIRNTSVQMQLDTRSDIIIRNRKQQSEETCQ